MKNVISEALENNTDVAVLTEDEMQSVAGGGHCDGDHSHDKSSNHGKSHDKGSCNW